MGPLSGKPGGTKLNSKLRNRLMGRSGQKPTKPDIKLMDRSGILLVGKS